MKCPFCGTDMVKRRVDVDRTWKGRTITFRGILAEVCPGCGEEAYAAEDVELMDSFIEGTLKNDQYPRLMNVEEVSSFLRVTPQTVYNMLRDGRIRAAKVGREWRFPRETLLELLRVSPVEPGKTIYRPGERAGLEKGVVKEPVSRFRARPKAKKRGKTDEN